LNVERANDGILCHARGFTLFGQMSQGSDCWDLARGETTLPEIQGRSWTRQQLSLTVF